MYMRNATHLLIPGRPLTSGYLCIRLTRKAEYLVKGIAPRRLHVPIVSLVCAVTHISPKLSRNGICRPLSEQQVHRLREFYLWKPINHLIRDILENSITRISNPFVPVVAGNVRRVLAGEVTHETPTLKLAL